MKFEFEPIGLVQTCFPERFGTPRQPGLVPSSWAVLKLRPELNLADALEGLNGFSHVWILFVFHRNTNKGINTKVHPPRLGGDKIGLFATRTPHRPNPIGLSVCKLERVDGDHVYLSGIDLLDGTPVLDIKPYVPSADAIYGARAGWTSDKPERTLEVEFSAEAEQQLTLLGRPGLRDLVRETLELDPRPGFYKGSAERENPYTDTYGVGIEDFNVVYRMKGRQATVLRLEPWQAWRARKDQTDDRETT